MRLIAIFLSVFVLGACSGGGGGSSTTTTYKYQVSGVSPLSISSYEDDISVLSSSFVLKWNEDSNGNISGIYTNQSTGQTISVTGVSDGTGRTIDGTLNPPVNGVSAIRLLIAQAGDLSGTINATLKTFDSGGIELSSQTVSVDATTSGSAGGGGGGGGAGTGTLNSYIGLYTGTMTEVSNQAIAGGVGNGKYCDFSFSGAEMKFELSNYLMFGYSTRYSQGNGAYVDVTGADPATLSVNINKGFPSATLMDYGYQDTGVKIAAADQSSSKQLAITFVGAFSGTTTKTLTGTLTAKLNSTAVCEFTVNMTKQ